MFHITVQPNCWQIFGVLIKNAILHISYNKLLIECVRQLQSGICKHFHNIHVVSKTYNLTTSEAILYLWLAKMKHWYTVEQNWLKCAEQLFVGDAFMWINVK